MYFDRFDVCLAWYHFLNDTHGGQWSPEYARLSRLLTYYRPPPSEEFHEGMGENSRAIYDARIEEWEARQERRRAAGAL